MKTVQIPHLFHRRTASDQRTRSLYQEAGVFSIEFAIVSLLFLTMIFGVLELSRAIYMINTLQESTRRAARAASITDFSDASAIQRVRQEAIFRSSSGTLAFGAPITDQHIVIDYMAQNSESSGAMDWVPITTLPVSPAGNKVICASNSNDSSCIRFVRVRVCQPNSNCTPVPYDPLFPLVRIPLDLPISTTIVRAQSLGYAPGMAVN